MRSGFIGLGDQGGPMARAIHKAGFDLTIWARKANVRASWREGGIAVVDDPLALAANVELLCLCVTDDQDVRALLIDQGLLDALPEGAIVALHSTIRPQSCVELATIARKRGVVLLDMPVSGSGPAAAAGQLLVMAGGDSAAVARVTPVVSSYAASVIAMGPVGHGMKAKLINNLMAVVNIGQAYRALALGRMMEIDTRALRSVLMAGSGQSCAVELIEHLQLPERAEHVQALLEKDVYLALDAMPANEQDYWEGQAATGLASLFSLATGRDQILPDEEIEDENRR